MLKLPKLPERTPVKLTLSLSPDLHQRLLSYAALYRETYGAAEPVADLIPYMLDAFMGSDRAYAKARKEDLPPIKEATHCQGHRKTNDDIPATTSTMET